MQRLLIGLAAVLTAVALPRAALAADFATCVRTCTASSCGDLHQCGTICQAAPSLDLQSLGSQGANICRAFIQQPAPALQTPVQTSVPAPDSGEQSSQNEQGPVGAAGGAGVGQAAAATGTTPPVAADPATTANVTDAGRSPELSPALPATNPIPVDVHTDTTNTISPPASEDTNNQKPASILSDLTIIICGLGVLGVIVGALRLQYRYDAINVIKYRLLFALGSQSAGGMLHLIEAKRHIYRRWRYFLGRKRQDPTMNGFIDFAMAEFGVDISTPSASNARIPKEKEDILITHLADNLIDMGIIQIELMPAKEPRPDSERASGSAKAVGLLAGMAAAAELGEVARMERARAKKNDDERREIEKRREQARYLQNEVERNLSMAGELERRGDYKGAQANRDVAQAKQSKINALRI